MSFPTLLRCWNGSSKIDFGWNFYYAIAPIPGVNAHGNASAKAEVRLQRFLERARLHPGATIGTRSMR
jgi:hypothetical protein